MKIKFYKKIKNKLNRRKVKKLLIKYINKTINFGKKWNPIFGLIWIVGQAIVHLLS